MRDILIDTLIQNVENLPFNKLHIMNVAEILGKSTNTIYRYVNDGYRVDNDRRIVLTRQPSGKFTKEDIIQFLNQLKSIHHEQINPRRYYRAVL